MTGPAVISRHYDAREQALSTWRCAASDLFPKDCGTPEPISVRSISLSQPIYKDESCQRCARPSGPLQEHMSVAMAVRCLEGVLRRWDGDHTNAKSQIKAVASMLRGDIDDPPMQERPNPTEYVVQGLLPWQARKVQEFIKKSLHSRVRLQDCASMVRLSTGYFSRAFKVTFGTNAVNYIHRLRIERAQQLMLDSKQPLSEIALACGFADQAHYCRVFRAVVGLSPTTWRRQRMVEAPHEYCSLRLGSSEDAMGKYATLPTDLSPVPRSHCVCCRSRRSVRLQGGFISE